MLRADGPTRALLAPPEGLLDLGAPHPVEHVPVADLLDELVVLLERVRVALRELRSHGGVEALEGLLAVDPRTARGREGEKRGGQGEGE